MKDTSHILLWKKIKDFNFDKPDTVNKFVNKLALQNNWTINYAEKVIEEYRRFIFLCCISPTGASPSKPVDKAWHLHLIYTKSYWIDLCKNTLNRDLHHNPSKGGDDEAGKHENWYKETLELYKQVFGVMPPPDIWAKPNEIINGIEAPNFFSGISQKRFVYVLIGFPLLFIIMRYNIFSPVNIDSNIFLIFYALLSADFAISLLIKYHFRANEIRKFIRTHFPSELSVFQLTAFLYGKDRAVQTTIVDLVRRGLLKMEENAMFVVNKHKLISADENPVARALSNEKDGKELTYEEIEGNWYKKENYNCAKLERIKEIVYAEPSQSYFFGGFIFLFGVTWAMQGIIIGQFKITLLLEIIVFLPLYLLYKFFTRKSIMDEETFAIYQERIKLSGKLHDEVVTDFAFRGNKAISSVNGGMLICSIFKARSSVIPDPSAGCGG